MIHPIIMPKFGQTVEESTVSQWMKREGDTVRKGDILFEAETDKVTTEVESFFEGTLLRILVQEGKTAPSMSVVAYIGDPGDRIPELEVVMGEPDKSN